jgi:polo-like kinase 4
VYEINKVLGQDSNCTVYVGHCVRGQLHDRNVALKKAAAFFNRVGHFTNHSSQMNVSGSTRQRIIHLRRSLHFPIILSLYAVVSMPGATYHILGLFSRDTLADDIRSHRDGDMSESQTRGVVRTLVDALMYLRKELIVHRDIKASNVLISVNSRVVSACNHSYLYLGADR